MEKDIRVPVNINDALDLASFLYQVIKKMEENARGPADELSLQPLRRFAIALENATLDQIDGDTLKQAIKENKSRYEG